MLLESTSFLAFNSKMGEEKNMIQKAFLCKLFFVCYLVLLCKYEMCAMGLHLNLVRSWWCCFETFWVGY